MKRLLLVLALLSSLALAQTPPVFGGSRSAGVPAAGGTFTGPIVSTSSVTADHLTTTAASGVVGIQGVTGQNWCLGTGATACVSSSDGASINLPTLVQAITSNINSNGNALDIRGGGTNNASAVAIAMHSYPDLTVAGAKIVTFAPDNANTIKASIDIGGMIQFGIGNTAAAPTCDATQRGKLWIVNGGTGVTDTVTLCLKAAANTYSWVAITTGG